MSANNAQADQISARDRAIWRAAISMASDQLMGDSSRLNLANGPIQVAHALSGEAARIRSWTDATDLQLTEWFRQAGVPPASS